MGNIKYMVAMFLLGCVLTGCTPGTEVSPSQSLSSAEPTTILTPTPTWTEEEQSAVDAVHRYLEVWADISHDLEAADWNRIFEVASDPAADNNVELWREWLKNGWHLIGGPTFNADLVTPGMIDHQGSRYHVHGCYIITGAHVEDAAGNPVGNRGIERGRVKYLVLHLTSGRYIVLEEVSEEAAC